MAKRNEQAVQFPISFIAARTQIVKHFDDTLAGAMREEVVSDVKRCIDIEQIVQVIDTKIHKTFATGRPPYVDAYAKILRLLVEE